MKKIYLLGLVLNIWGMAFTQTITIIDYETNEPLERVTLLCESPSAFTTTNEKGQAEISVFKGAEKIEIRRLGYKTENISYGTLQKSGLTFPLVLTGVSVDEVVISASKFEERQADVVQTIQVMRSSQLQGMNQTSMADVVTSTGNIMVQKSQLGGGSPIIRGFEANKVLMVIDGVRMNNAIYRGGHLQNVITLDNSIMERVEVVYGPGSVVYGSDALGGVMHFYTKNPELSAGDSTVVKAEAYARYFSAAKGMATHADVSVGGKRFGSLTSFTYSDFGDLMQGAVRNPFYGNFGSRPWYVERFGDRDSTIVNSDSNLQVGSAYKQYDILQKFMFRQSAKITHLLNFQYSTSSDIPRYDRLTQWSNGHPKYGEWYYGPQKRLFASYSLLLGSGSFYDNAKIILGYQNIEESRNTRRYNSTSLSHQIEQLDIFTLNADFDKLLGKNEIRYGVEAFTNKVNSTANDEDIITGTSTPSETRYPDGGSTMSSFALYGTHSWEINEKFILNDGLRLTYIGLTSKFIDKSFFPFPYDEVNQSNMAVNGNIGLIYMPGMAWRLTASLSSGFRAPNVDDMSKVFESVPGSVIVPNPDLKPEYTYNGELGISKTFNHRVTTSILSYYTLYQNALTVAPTQFQGQDSIMYDGELSRVTSTVNEGKAYIYGIEGRFAGNINEYLSVVATINYTYGRIKTDTTDYPLDHIPPVFGKISLNTNRGNFRGEFFLNFSGWKRLEDYNINGEDNIENATPYGMPAWYTLNASLTYQFTKALSLQVACENILDQNYRVYASNISAPGRNFIFTLRGNF